MVRIGVLTLTLALAQALALALGLALALALALTVTLTRWRRTTGRSGVQRRQHRRQQMAMVHLPTSPYFSLHPPISPHISPYLPDGGEGREGGREGVWCVGDLNPNPNPNPNPIS